MYQILIYMFIIVSFMITLLIILQPSKQQDVLSLLASDKSNALFETQKARGVQIILRYGTAFLGILWLILSIVLMYLGNK
ncbi:preprotein translocase subunit SecG [Lactococcus lactis]|nr:preprotein translocase subunit SecG [Lactococcus lactis]